MYRDIYLVIQYLAKCYTIVCVDPGMRPLRIGRASTTHWKGSCPTGHTMVPRARAGAEESFVPSQSCGMLLTVLSKA